MFYYALTPILTYNWILIAIAVIPAIFLMVKVYKSDRIEKESKSLLRRLVTGGILATLLALVEERVGEYILRNIVEVDSLAYNIIMYFGIVAFAEETSKYLYLKKRTWNNPEFNCQYDGVVYAVFVSLGFALWENINYVLSYGIVTGLVRAVTAIPGHACFGVFMGIFYGAAKKYSNYGSEGIAKILRVLAVIVPAFIHGAYDFIATMESTEGNLSFFIFIAVLFGAALFSINKASKKDQYIV